MDKRSVHTDALDTLGFIITEGSRDAIHIAVEPVEAGERLLPGQHIGFVDGKASQKAAKLLGIVDPFIQGFIMPGEKFWMLIYPRSITSLRHVWAHPEFDVAPVLTMVAQDKAASEKWLRDWCDNNDCPSYDTIMAALLGIGIGTDNEISYEIDHDYFTFRNTDSHASIPQEFWDHVEIVTGKKQICRPAYFSCAC